MRALRQLAVISTAVLVATTLVSTTPNKATADPGCRNGGVLLMWARGSGAALRPQSDEASNFFASVGFYLTQRRIPYTSVQVGDEDGNGGKADGALPNGIGWQGVDPGEYPAVPWNQWAKNPLSSWAAMEIASTLALTALFTTSTAGRQPVQTRRSC